MYVIYRLQMYKCTNVQMYVIYRLLATLVGTYYVYELQSISQLGPVAFVNKSLIY